MDLKALWRNAMNRLSAKAEAPSPSAGPSRGHADSPKPHGDRLADAARAASQGKDRDPDRSAGRS